MMTDSDGGGWQVPGFSLHREFDELEKAGLSPLHVLQMTTLNPAEYLGRTADLGSVEAGKQADLVLLEANPIDSIQNLHKINAVVRVGFYYSRQDLDALENEVAAHPLGDEYRGNRPPAGSESTAQWRCGAISLFHRSPRQHDQERSNDRYDRE
jgi:hypothetical protein